jgi:hypothetical protein
MAFVAVVASNLGIARAMDDDRPGDIYILVSDQGNRRTLIQDHRWDAGFLGALSQIAQESQISQ